MLKRIGVLLLCVAVCLGLYGCGEKKEVTLSPDEQESYNERATALLLNYEGTDTDARIKFLTHDVTTKGEYSYINGSLQNIGFDSVTHIKVTAKFFDNKGNVIDSDYTIITNTIKIDEQKKFEIIYKGTDFAEYKLYATDVE